MEITHNTSQTSIEIEKNSKGVKWTVKVYADTDEELTEKLDKTIKLAKVKANALLLEDM